MSVRRTNLPTAGPGKARVLGPSTINALARRQRTQRSQNVTFLSLPPRAPELNPQENVWQFMRANWLSSRIFKSFDEIVDHYYYAWNTLIDQPWKIMSIARRDWAVAGHLL